MRIGLAVVALLALAAAAPAKDWRTNAVIAPSGAFVVGNPAARVTLVEYLSFTCPHCGHFLIESTPKLYDAYVRGGSVRVETRSAARDPYDLAAWVVARCAGPRRFHALATAIFKGQEGWMTKGQAYAQANLDALKAKPQMEQLRILTRESGLAGIAATQGLTQPALDRCLASEAQLKPILAMTEAAFAKISGTPGFEVNGTLAADTYDWATLEPKLRAAGAR